jgi:hypothetical protein
MPRTPGRFRRQATALVIAAVLPLAAACGAAATTTDSTGSSTTSTTTDTGLAGDADRGGPAGGGADISSAASTADLDALVQAAYGEASLGLHRGHQDVEATLIEVLGITHDEMHVRMEEQGQNLAAIAEDLGVDRQQLVDALVETYFPGVETVLASGGITDAQAEKYRAALEEAFTYRVTWDGEEATPTFEGLSA